MHVTGIIAEYNPFHNGHKYQLDRVKEQGSDYCIAVMSGDFTERGEPAIYNKYTRTRMALMSGVDLVIELPVVFATADAGQFARGGISILNSLGVVDEIAFGVEPGSEELIPRVAEFLNDSPTLYEDKFDKLLRNGLTFPEARQKALADFFSKDNLDALAGSNAILGLEYCKALLKSHSKIKPVMIPRVSNNYNDENLSDDGISSATAIRQLLEKGDSANIASQIPGYLLDIINEARPLKIDDFSGVLGYKLLTSGSYTEYADITGSFNDRVRNHLAEYRDYSQFVDLIKTRNITYTSCQRLLMHILLDMKTGAPTEVPYARILGFRKESEKLLGEIKQKSRIPMITKLADAKMCDCLSMDIKAANIYESVYSNLYHDTCVNEYTEGVVII